MKSELEDSLLPQKSENNHPDSSLPMRQTAPTFTPRTLIQGTIAILYTLPFIFNARTLDSMIEQMNYPLCARVPLYAMNYIGAGSIVITGYYLYGTHAYSAMTGEDIQELT